MTNPAFAEAMKLESACLALEDRYGLSIKAKAAISLTIGQAQVTAADLNRMAQEPDADEDIVEAELVEGWSS